MAGGTWSKLSLKERPGTYINWETKEQNIIGIAERGTVIMPLLGHNYGPAKEFITIENGSPDAQYAKLGYSVYEKPLLLVKEALKSAKTIILYIPAQGEQASGSVTIGDSKAEETEISAAVRNAVSANLGVKEGLTGCELDYNESGRSFAIMLTGPISGVKNTGVFDALSALLNDGYATTIDGSAITGLADFKKTDSYKSLTAMAEGDSLTITAIVSKGGESEDYTVNVSYPGVAGARVAGANPTAENVLTAKAMYGGERGNDLSFDCVANEDGGYDVTVYLDNSAVEEFEGLNTVGELMAAGSSWITFKGIEEAELSDFSAISLTGGTNGVTNTIDITRFLDSSEAVHWNTMAFPLDSKENSSLMTAVVSKILGMLDGQEAVRQAIHKAIITPRWKCLIYDNQYGSEIEAAVIQSQGRASNDYIEAVVPGFVRDALRPDRRITLVYNFVFAFTPEDKAKLFPDLFEAVGDDGDAVFVSFDADTIYGTVQMKEVI